MGGDLTEVLVYALGGGHGHAVRGAGVAAALAKRRKDVDLLVPATHLDLARQLAPEVPVLGMAPPDGPTLPTEVAERIEHAQTLVVDTFPEGVRGELSGTKTQRLALLRLRRDAEHPRFRDGLAACNAALDLEPQLQWLDLDVDRLAPVARTMASGDDDGSVCLLDGGDEALAQLFDKLGRRLHAVGLPVRRRSASGPLLAFTSRPRVVVGPAGYNLTYELAAAGIHHLAIPRRRPYDDQTRRARAVAEVFTRPEALEGRVLELCLRPAPRLSVDMATYDDVASWIVEKSQAHSPS